MTSAFGAASASFWRAVSRDAIFAFAASVSWANCSQTARSSGFTTEPLLRRFAGAGFCLGVLTRLLRKALGCGHALPERSDLLLQCYRRIDRISRRDEGGRA